MIKTSWKKFYKLINWMGHLKLIVWNLPFSGWNQPAEASPRSLCHRVAEWFERTIEIRPGPPWTWIFSYCSARLSKVPFPFSVQWWRLFYFNSTFTKIFIYFLNSFFVHFLTFVKFIFFITLATFLQTFLYVNSFYCSSR